MEIIGQIKKVTNTTYLDEEGDEFRVRLKKGLSKEDIDNLKLKSPGNRLSINEYCDKIKRYSCLSN